MKMLPLCGLLAAFLILLAPVVAHADLLRVKEITLTGTFYQKPASDEKPIVATPLTTSRLLILFGQPGIKPASTAYFTDPGTGSLTLASKDGSTVYGAVYTTTPEAGPPDTGFSGKGNKQSRALIKATAIKGLFSGSGFGTTKSSFLKTGRKLTSRVTFTGEGTLDSASSPNALIQFTVTTTIIQKPL